MAQLGARLNGIQKVRGSNPLSSTNKFKDCMVLSITRLPQIVYFLYSWFCCQDIVQYIYRFDLVTWCKVSIPQKIILKSLCPISSFTLLNLCGFGSPGIQPRFAKSKSHLTVSGMSSGFIPSSPRSRN